MHAKPGKTPNRQSRKLNGGYWLLTILSLLSVALITSCRVIQTAADLPGQTIRTVTPGKQGKDQLDPVELQQTLLRFADGFSRHLVVGVDSLRRGTNVLDPEEILKWKIALVSETTSIVSGPNALANMFDMTVFVTATRMALERHWEPMVFGMSAQPMLESCRTAETNIWQLADTFLEPQQRVELHGAIEMWYRHNPFPENVLTARTVDFTTQVLQADNADTARPDSVFSLLKIDPLSGMDPAVREITKTRMFAERALYVAQKLPMVLRWQIELLTMNTTAQLEVRQLVTNSTQIAASVERFAAVAEKLPGQLSTEREKILSALESQEKHLTPLVGEVRESLTAGTQMSTSLNTTITLFDALMKRFGVGETNSAGPPDPNAQPFRIQDYTTTAAQLEATARQLTEMLVTLDRTISSTNLAQLSAQVAPVIQQTQTGGKEVVDYAFRKGILLVCIALVAALIYRLLATRMTATHPKINSP